MRLPLVACVVVATALTGACASESDAGGGVDILGGGESTGEWPSSVPRPDLPLVEETDLLIAYTATYELRGGTVDDYAATLESEGFAQQRQSTYGDDAYVVLLEVEGDRLFVTITTA